MLSFSISFQDFVTNFIIHLLPSSILAYTKFKQIRSFLRRHKPIVASIWPIVTLNFPFFTIRTKNLALLIRWAQHFRDLCITRDCFIFLAHFFPAAFHFPCSSRCLLNGKPDREAAERQAIFLPAFDRPAKPQEEETPMATTCRRIGNDFVDGFD